MSKQRDNVFLGTRRYRPLARLGQGGMGTVYAVQDTATGARVALKVMREQSPQHVFRFKREFRVVAELHHPNLVHLFDLVFEDDCWLFTMELIEGCDVFTALTRGHGDGAPDTTASDDTHASTWLGTSRSVSLEQSPRSIESAPAESAPADTAFAESAPAESAPADTAFADTFVPVNRIDETVPLSQRHRSAPTHVYRGALADTGTRAVCDLAALTSALGQIVDALDFLHSHDIVHGDLKPSNTMVSPDGRVRLLDFGLALRVASTRGALTGAMAGTPAYMAPEQCRGQPATPASDMYALGCMLFQLLTGRLPFRGTVTQQMAGHLRRMPPRVESYAPHAPPRLCGLCHQLLSKQPDHRPSTDDVRRVLGLERASSGPQLADPSHRLVGRQRERERLSECLDTALGGQISLALVVGPSGIGKSYLGDALAADARERGFLCLRGRCYEREQVPFVAFDRAVDALIATALQWPAARRAAMREPLAAARSMFPALGMLIADSGAAPPPLASDPRARRQRAVDGFCQLLGHMQSVTPVLLILDDLQWADEDSLDLFEAVLAQMSGRLALFGFVRRQPAADTAVDALADALVDRMTAAGGADTTVIPLQGLDAQHATRLIESVAGRSLPADALAALVRAGDGNPFLLSRLANHHNALVASDADERIDDAVAPPTGRPDRPADWLHTLVGGLSADAAHVLSLAATQGGDIDKALLFSVSEQSNEAFEVALGELFSKRLLRYLSAGSRDVAAVAHTQATARLDVYHDRFREHAYQRLRPAFRRLLHRRLACALEARADERDAAALFRHYSEAGDRDKRRRYALIAAEQAAEQLAFQRAAALVEAVLDDPGPQVTPQVRAGHWERVADLRSYAGQPQAARRAYGRSLAIWRAQPASLEARVAQLRIHRGLAKNAFTVGELVHMRRAFADGLALLGLPMERSLVGRFATLMRLRLGLVTDRGIPMSIAAKGAAWEEEQVRFFDFMSRSCEVIWPLPAVEMSLRCESLGRRLVLQQVHQHALASSAGAAALLGRLSTRARRRAHRDLDTAEILAQQYDLPLGREYVALNRALLYVAVDNDRALREVRAAQAGIERRGRSEYQDGARARMVSMLIAMQRGDYDDFFRSVERERAARPGHFMNVTMSRLQRVSLYCLLGRLQAARREMADLDRQLRGAPESVVTLSVQDGWFHIWTAEGQFARVLDADRRCRPLLFKLGVPPTSLAGNAWRLRRLTAYIGLARRGALGRYLHARASIEARLLAHTGSWDFPCMGYWAQCLLAHANGRTRTARRALATALRMSAHNTAPDKRWRCLQAATELDMLTPARVAERDRLQASYGFVLPRGW